MGTKAADFIERVASANIQDARKKESSLEWTRGGMFLSIIPGVRSIPKGCALGIAELAACSSIRDIGHAVSLSDMEGRSRLGKGNARAKLSQKVCPIEKECDDFGFISTAEEAVMHINDNHAKSWKHCKSLLRRFARLERIASRS